MPYLMTVSPDIGPEKIEDWFIFNTWLQRHLGQAIRLTLYPSFHLQREAIQNDQVDLIYANPFDAALLIRKKGFTPIAAASNSSDEAVIAVHTDSAFQQLEDLPTACRAVMTASPDINRISRMLLEPADITTESLQTNIVDTYILVAKHVLQQQAELGFFLADAFDNLSTLVRNQLRELVRSQIHDIRHVLLAHQRLAPHYDLLRQVLSNMHTAPKGSTVLKSLGFCGWTLLQQEDAEFMIDLMDTLAE